MDKRGKRRLRMVVALIPTLVASIAMASPAAAEPRMQILDPVPATFESWEQLFEIQGRINDALVKVTNGSGKYWDAGFGGEVAAPENRELRIYWKGELPEPV